MMATPEQRAWLVLLRAPGLGPAHLLKLIEATGSAETALAAGSGLWRKAGLDDKTIQALSHPDEEAVDAGMKWLAHPQHTLIPWTDPRYPPPLREIQLPPPALFIHGRSELLSQPQIAIVGARSASAQGREDARSFGSALVKAGVTVTSGLALGIDGAAHRGALEAGGPTIAVCGNGLDRVYPARHRDLAHAIARDGALVSEFPPGTPPLPAHFPRRNRIISGLSLGVLVVQAAKASGSLITARLAAEQGREVFAVPGSIHQPLSSGCHALIRDGAKLVECVEDILEEFGISSQATDTDAAEPAPASLDADQTCILEVIGDEAISIDELLEKLGLPLPQVHQALLALELAGLIASSPGGHYSRLHSSKRQTR